MRSSFHAWVLVFGGFSKVVFRNPSSFGSVKRGLRSLRIERLSRKDLLAIDSLPLFYGPIDTLPELFSSDGTTDEAASSAFVPSATKQPTSFIPGNSLQSTASTTPPPNAAVADDFFARTQSSDPTPTPTPVEHPFTPTPTPISAYATAIAKSIADRSNATVGTAQSTTNAITVPPIARTMGTRPKVRD